MDQMHQDGHATTLAEGAPLGPPQPPARGRVRHTYKVYFTTSQVGHQTDFMNQEYPALMRERLLSSPTPRHTLVDDPRVADLILFWEDNIQSDLMWNRTLRQHPLVRQFPEKCFVVNHEDLPEDWLPGVYTSIPWERFDPWRHRTGCYCITFNEFIAPSRDSAATHEPSLLTSFRGDVSSPVRRALLAHDFGRDDVRFTQSQPFLFFSYHDEERHKPGRRLFVNEIIDTRFPLCPRGVGPSSHRLFEVMQLARPPVILSDSWVPAAGPAWDEFSIRIAERHVRELPAILEAWGDDWREMGRRAQRAFDEWFAPAVQATRAIEACAELQRVRVQPESLQQARWPARLARLRARQVYLRCWLSVRRALKQ